MGKEPTYEELKMRIRDLEQILSQNGVSQPDRSEELYRHILESISDTVVLTDDKGNMTYVCPNTGNIFGISQSEVYELKNIQKLLDGSACNISDLNEKGEIQNIEWSIRDSFGQTRHLLINAKSVNIDGGRALFSMRDITERKKAEVALRESEHRYRQLFETMRDGFGVADINANIIQVNKAFTELSGYSEDELYNMTFEDITPPKWHDFERQIVKEQVLKRGYSDYFEKEYIRKDGSIIPVEVIISLTTDHQGNPSYFWGIVRDITERKETEDALREALLKQNEAVRAGKVGLWDWDLITDKVFYSTEWKRLIGYEDHEISNDFVEWQSRVHTDDLKRVLDEVKKTIATGRQDHKVEFRFRHRDGSYRWIMAQASITQDKAGQSVRMLGTHVDITDLKSAEETIAETLNVKDSLVRALGEIIYEWRPLLDTVLWDGEYTRILGYSAHEMGNDTDSWTSRIHPDDLENALAEVEDAKNQNRFYDMEYRFRCRDGSYRWMCDRGVLLTNEEGALERVIGVFKDINNRKTIENELIQSGNKLKQAQKIANIGNWHWDISSNKVEWSEQIYKIFKAPLKKPSYEMARDFVHPEDLALWDKTIRSAVENKKPFKLDYRAIRTDGKVVWVHNETDTILDSSGNMIGYEGTVQDITARKHAEQKILDSEIRFRTAVSHSGIIFAQTDGDLRYTWIHNPHSDFTEESVLGKRDDELYNNEGCNALIRFKKKVIDSKERQREQIDFQMSNGIYSYDIIGEPIRKAEGAIVGVSAAAIDITERKRSERALQASENKYRKMMESFVDPLYICSSDFTVEYMNPEMVQRTGRDATGEKCYSALHGLEFKCDWCIFDKVSSGETTETNIKSPLDGKTYRVTNMPIRNQDGTISKMTIFRDITDYLEAVSEKEKAQKQLIQTHKMESIGNLAGGIAHDFNNILSSIIGFTELSLDDVKKGTHLEDNLQEIYAAGKRAKDLVKQILAFARQSEDERKPIQVDLIVKEVLKFIRSSIPTTIEIRQNIESESLITGNATQIHQVLMNLCTNAAHAMENDGGILEVGLKDITIDRSADWKSLDLKLGDYIEITVSDTGTGIHSKNMEKVFEPYFTTKAPGEGTGMGLAMVQGVVESYNGKITVESQVGKGTTFTIYLPISKKRSAQDAYVAEELPPGTESIMFVDDEAPIAKMGSQILEQLGYSVTTRTSSIEALELFQTKPNDFDLVVTDMTMPNMTGDNLAVELMKIRPDIPVILCTGYSKKISDETASEIGIKAFAYKPVVKADLAITVRKVLDEAKG